MVHDIVATIRRWHAYHEDLETLRRLVVRHMATPAGMASFKSALQEHIDLLVLPPERLRRYSSVILQAAADTAARDNRIDATEQKFLEELPALLNMEPDTMAHFSETLVESRLLTVLTEETLPIIAQGPGIRAQFGLKALPQEVAHYIAHGVQPFTFGKPRAKDGVRKTRWLTPCSVLVTNKRVVLLGGTRNTFFNHAEIQGCGLSSDKTTIVWSAGTKEFNGYTSASNGKALHAIITRLAARR